MFSNFTGAARLRVTSGDASGMLFTLTKAGIILKDVDYESDICFTFTVSGKDFHKTQRIITRRGDSCELIKQEGGAVFLRRLRKRIAFLSGILFFLILTVWIPRRVFFIEIVGNNTVDDSKILHSAESNGVTFGCVRSELRSDMIKNKIIEDIPELDWVGVTTQGCVATIQVSEKMTKQDYKETKSLVSSLVASQDGIIQNITATNGKILCKPGQAVYKGQMLISGYEDFGLVLKGCNAEGEIFAKTFHYIDGISPRLYGYRTEISERKTAWSLRIGKKLINFSKDSGISPYSCVKMYSEYYLTLPGGFQLPVCLIRQHYVDYDLQDENETENSSLWISSDLESYLHKQMIAGEILSARESAECLDDVFYFSGRYACLEQIGQRKIEETLEDYGKNS